LNLATGFFGFSSGGFSGMIPEIASRRSTGIADAIERWSILGLFWLNKLI